jgi:hypothetical protein
MTITATSYSPDDYVADGIAHTFAFTFDVADAAHVKVYLNGVLQAVGYTLDLTLKTVAFVDGMGLPLPPTATFTIRIARVTPRDQLQIYTYPSTTHERGLDKLTQIAQEIEQDLVIAANAEAFALAAEGSAIAAGVSEAGAAVSAANAALSEGAAAQSAIDAAAAVPPIVLGDADKVMTVKADESGYELRPAKKRLHIQHQEPSGIAGGGATSGSPEVRTLNTVMLNEITGASLAANQITLPAGTYFIRASAPAYMVVQHKSRLYDTTGVAVLVHGTAERTATASGGSQTRSHIVGSFTLAVASVLEIQTRVGTSYATTGYGVHASYGTEVYVDVLIEQT